MTAQRHSDAVIGVIARCLQQRAPNQLSALYVLVEAGRRDPTWSHSGYRLAKWLRPLKRKLLIERQDNGFGALRWFPTDTGRRVIEFIRANPL